MGHRSHTLRGKGRWAACAATVLIASVFSGFDVVLGQGALTPIIGVSHSQYDFGTVSIGSPSLLNESVFNVSSDSTSLLLVTEITIDGDGFTLVAPPDSATISGGDAISLPIRFQPLDSGHSVGQVTIVAPDAPNSPLVIPLSGSGAQDSLFLMDTDSYGFPIYCGTTSASSHPRSVTARAYDVIPCVIRNVPQDFFIVEIDAKGPVTAVSIVTSGTSGALIAPSYPTHLLRDDGQGYDRVAGDFIFTSDAFIYDVTDPIGHLYGDQDSPDGLEFVHIADSFVIEELDHSLWQFGVRPTVGVLRSDIPLVTLTPRTSTMASTNHLINIKTADRVVQGKLRSHSPNIQVITNAIYDEYPDAADFLCFVSTDIVENMDHDNYAVAAIHETIKVNWVGTGQSPRDDTAIYGSAGRLLGLNYHDYGEHGTYIANFAHELTHQWEAWISPSFQLHPNNDGAHWDNQTNVASLVGGYRWVDNGNGTFTIDVSEGRNNGHQASPMSQYMMGLVDGQQMHTIYRDFDLVAPYGGQVVHPEDIDVTVEIEDIQAAYGVRDPGPAGAQRDFTIGCVVETHNRFLTQVEATFYETLVSAMTAIVPEGQPDPYVKRNWVSINRFWPGTTWRAAFPTQVAIADTQPVPMILSTTSLPSVTSSFTEIECELPRHANFRVCIYDVNGRLVRELHNGSGGPGLVRIRWDGLTALGSRVAGGVYFYRVEQDGLAASRRVTIVR